MNLTVAPNLVWSVQMNLWWFNSGGNSNPNDTLKVMLSDGTNVSTVLEYYSDDSGMQWVPVTASVDATIFDLTNLTVMVSTADWQTDGGHLVEAGVDNFKMTNNTAVSSAEPFSVAVYPNPSAGLFTVSSATKLVSYELYDLSSKLIRSGAMDSPTFEINTKGVYLLVVNSNSGSIAKKLVVY